MTIYPSFSVATQAVGLLLRDRSFEVRGSRWQSTDVSTKPEMRMREVLSTSFQVALGYEDLDHWRKDIQPNLPWADDHFEERVGGRPLNPGEQWKNWPWALAADKHRTENTGYENRFSHTYMERYWPKAAGLSDDMHTEPQPNLGPTGIRYDYGDLNDVVDHLLGDPLTRQAYLPVWFPEDTGVVHGERVPCSLGYHWILRNGYLHTTYYIRSCDYVRHFRDDLYLSVRLTIWLLDQLRAREDGKDRGRDPNWTEVRLGLFNFHCVSMHLFVNDWNRLYGKEAASGSR